MPEKSAVSVNSRVLQAHRHRADQPGVVGPAQAGHRQRQQQPRHVVAQHEVEHHQDREQRDDDEAVVERHQQPVDHARPCSRRSARSTSDRRRLMNGHGDAEQQRVADGDRELPEHVLAARVGAERIGPAGRHVRRHDVGVVRRIRREERQPPPWRRRCRAARRPARRRGWCAAGRAATRHMVYRTRARGSSSG